MESLGYKRDGMGREQRKKSVDERMEAGTKDAVGREMAEGMMRR